MNLVTPTLAQISAFNPEMSAMAVSDNSNAVRIIGIVLISLAVIGMVVLISKSFTEMSKRMIFQNQQKASQLN